ncbi:MAG: fructose-1,6-bisphosphatase [Firmicutes bacterium]|nr:fructose-1,6-bisphosphatase [Clostridia bacterium]MBQ6294406.1 fructose-1,6-bisphosphatase [Bacillota bacterium]MBR0210402.1 fructose-1,6-bisphosphatase [Bacillota bacterium]
MNYSKDELKYLKLLAEEYGTVSAASAEIINLTAIQNLPKGTEHFLSDIHGEYESFNHILRNASGTIKLKIDETFTDMTPEERRSFATLVYYPEEKLEILKEEQDGDLHAFYSDTLNRLIKLLELVTFKYSRSYVRKRLGKEYAYIIEELLYGSNSVALGRGDHRQNIIESIIDVDAADDFIINLCRLISKFSIFRLHILGDVYDRGPGGDVVLDILKNYHSVDIQWGNHDILWMGAAAGNKACIANVIRICTRYDNLHTLEVGYGISLRPLVTFAMNTYGNDPCPNFKAVASTKDAMYDADLASLSKISKAIAIMQFKLEGQLIEKHPYYEMDALRLLDKVDYEKYTVTIDGKEYPMNNTFFPTIDPADPYRLSDEEEAVMNRLQRAFLESELLQDHVQFLFANGGLYKCVNGNLLFHGCMPLTEDGRFDNIQTSDGYMSGKEWFDYADRLVRTGYFGKASDKNKQRGIDFFWYLWCGYKSPLFGKKKITTFERLFVEDESTWVEAKNPYYKLIEKENGEQIVEHILADFGCDTVNGIIINGHMPVKKGSNPVKANGRAICIDGGFAKPYQKTTGIAGYSLIQNSYGFILTAHEAFQSRAKAVAEELDIHSTQVAREDISVRMLNKDTDQGIEMQDKIDGLKMLLEAYRTGLITQTAKK